ncbi:hypothetical protein [Pseudoxanthomonas sacheonensis]|uniref:DUF5666 domain-containing protein n=1 Tax=Pseudoxanthomonas sacheonensis TaxID=443615 RepID=A0ABU1RRX3_9GAMM|nr:hypothetical protein [Pseudoxanthomonas sacheonensis]MDR6841517.1 hypothetical protein [Pseudoxanthomonas sacheonensis]
MIQCIRTAPLIRLFALSATLIALSACAVAPARDALVVGQQATIDGEVVRVDTDPWAYDGNAVITVSSAAAGTVGVQLPARWNLCKAPPLGDVQALKPGDRVQAVGTVTAPGEMLVCERPQHRLRKVE